MPHITKAHKKESIVSFAKDAVRVINEKLNLNDLTKKETLPIFEFDGWCYYLHKSIANVKPEIRIKRENFRNKKDLPKGSRIYEEAFIYIEGMNCPILGIDENDEYICDKDKGFLINGFSVQDYKKTAF